MKKKVKNDLGFVPYGTQLLVEWISPTDKKTDLILSEELSRGQEAELNGVNQVVAAGHQCDLVEEGDWVMLPPVPLPILNFNGKEYGMIREHQLLGVFPDGKPSDDMIRRPDMGLGNEIKLDKTADKVKAFQDKVTKTNQANNG
jgi:hypothetical protein